MAHINTRAARNANRKPAGLTVPKATADARKIVNRVMPGVNTTVESKLSHNLATDTPTVITTVTFPADCPGHLSLAVVFEVAGGPWGDMTRKVFASSSLVITRKA